VGAGKALVRRANRKGKAMFRKNKKKGKNSGGKGGRERDLLGGPETTRQEGNLVLKNAPFRRGGKGKKGTSIFEGKRCPVFREKS